MVANRNEPEMIAFPTEADMPALELKKTKSKHRRKSARKSMLVLESNFQPGRYFWLQILVLKETELLFRPAESVRAHIHMNLDRELMEVEMQKFEYMSLMSLAMLARLKAMHAYSEKRLENSAICEHGLWKISKYNAIYANYLKHSDSLECCHEENIRTPGDLLSLFERHENNFRSCLHTSILKKLVQEDGKWSSLSIFINSSPCRFKKEAYSYR